MIYLLYIAIGMAAGLSSALLGIGGGVIMVPILLLLFGLGARAATATSLAFIAPIALYGALKQWHMQMDLRWTLALLAVPGGLVGAELGSRLKEHISDAHLRLLFALLMVVVGVRIGYRAWHDLRGSPSEPPTAEVVEPPPAT